MSETQTIYLVEGMTGEYSDSREWPVAAYMSEAEAQAHAKAANAEAERIFKAVGNEWWSVKEGANPFDPEMSMDYSGTYYRVYPVELRDRFAADPLPGKESA